MSYNIIRFGGNRIPDEQFIKNLTEYISGQDGFNIIVVSAHDTIAGIVTETISTIFHNRPEFMAIEAELAGIFSRFTGSSASDQYISLIHSFIKLIKGIHLTGDYSASLRDQVLSFGEKFSAEILKLRIERAGLKTRIILPEEIELEVTEDFGNATYLNLNREILEKYCKDSVIIIPGSYGKTGKGKLARAGVSAADYTAAFLTALLNSSGLVLWGMDKPFYNADPFRFDGTKKIARLTYSEASELAYFDHYSFHPRTVEPLEKKHIPILIFGDDPGKPETIINTETFVAKEIVKGVAYSDDVSLLKLDGPGVGLKPGILAKVTTCLNDSGINIRSVITSQVAINFILDRESGEKALSLITQLGFTSVREISLETGVSMIGVIGHGMQQHYGVFAKVFSAAANEKINILLSGSGASDLSDYLIVKTVDRDRCVKAIHSEFFN